MSSLDQEEKAMSTTSLERKERVGKENGVEVNPRQEDRMWNSICIHNRNRLLPPGLSVAPAMENYTQFPLKGTGASLRAQPDRLHPAAGHGLLQELVVPL